MKKLVELAVEGAKILDICLEGDKLIEQGTGAVYNKAVKGVKVPKGALCLIRSCARADHTIFSPTHPHTVPREILPACSLKSIRTTIAVCLAPHITYARPRVPDLRLRQQLRRALLAARV